MLNCFFRYLWSEPVIVRLTAVSEMNDFEFVPDFLNIRVARPKQTKDMTGESYTTYEITTNVRGISIFAMEYSA